MHNKMCRNDNRLSHRLLPQTNNTVCIMCRLPISAHRPKTTTPTRMMMIEEDDDQPNDHQIIGGESHLCAQCLHSCVATNSSSSTLSSQSHHNRHHYHNQRRSLHHHHHHHHDQHHLYSHLNNQSSQQSTQQPQSQSQQQRLHRSRTTTATTTKTTTTTTTTPHYSMVDNRVVSTPDDTIRDTIDDDANMIMILTAAAAAPAPKFSSQSRRHRRSKAETCYAAVNRNLLRTCWLLVFSALLCISKISCDGIFELRLDEFVNELNRDASGQCCLPSTSSSSSSQALQQQQQQQQPTCHERCHTYFRVCFTNYQAKAIHDFGTCVYGEKRTPVLDAEQISSQVLSLPFHYGWQGTFLLIIEAWNNITAYAPADGHKTPVLIGRFIEKRSKKLPVGKQWTSTIGRIATDQQHQQQIKLRFSYRFQCPANYYGETCGKKCTPRNDTYGHYDCSEHGEIICHPGYSAPANYCQKADCNDCVNGFCDLPNQCKCRVGWTGDRCDQCVRHPGCVHGYCNGSNNCICEEGWGGRLCNKDLNYCTHNPGLCKNGGICSNTGESLYTCLCPVGFAGKNCEKEVDMCENRPCKNGATCKSHGPLNYTCECPIGFTGANCDRLESACTNNPCENGGKCVDGPSGYLCHCKLGYSGNRCETRQKSCTPNPCLNGGNCVTNSSVSAKNPDDTTAPYTCQCRAGFAGSHCERNIDDCESNPCLNGATCIDEINSYRCLCVPGFIGDSCQMNVNDCLMQPCANGGSCVDRVNDYECRCPLGFAGKDCSINVNDCASNPCRNGATCRDGINEFVCDCSRAFFGPHCEFVNASAASALFADGRGRKLGSSIDFDGDDDDDEDGNVFSDRQLAVIIIGAVALPLIAILLLVCGFVLCKQYRRRDAKSNWRRDAAEARRQNEHNAVMSGLTGTDSTKTNNVKNNCFAGKAFEHECYHNPSAANVIVNALDRAQSLHHLHHLQAPHHRYQQASPAQPFTNKVTNEYVYAGRANSNNLHTIEHPHKAATLQRHHYHHQQQHQHQQQQQHLLGGEKMLNIDVDQPQAPAMKYADDTALLYGHHTYEQIQKPSVNLTNNLHCGGGQQQQQQQQIYHQVQSQQQQQQQQKQQCIKPSNVEIYSSLVSPSVKSSDCPPVMMQSSPTSTTYVDDRANEYFGREPQKKLENNNNSNQQQQQQKPYSNLQNNIQIAATLQRMQGCRSNSIYVIGNSSRYSSPPPPQQQPIYGNNQHNNQHNTNNTNGNDPKKLHATEV